MLCLLQWNHFTILYTNGDKIDQMTKKHIHKRIGQSNHTSNICLFQFVQTKNLYALFVQNSKLIHQKISLPAFMKILKNIKQENPKYTLEAFFVNILQKIPDMK